MNKYVKSEEDLKDFREQIIGKQVITVGWNEINFSDGSYISWDLADFVFNKNETNTEYQKTFLELSEEEMETMQELMDLKD